MCDAWSTGIAAMQNLSGPSAAAGNPATAFAGESMIGVMGAMADLAAGGQNNASAADIVLPVGRAMTIAATRSVSYWLSLAQILASHQARAVRAVGAEAVDGSAPGSGQLLATDELRALLREVGDLATREARSLQSELGTLSDSLAQTLQQPDLSTPYRRRWRAKL
jgi:hypothetical protein